MPRMCLLCGKTSALVTVRKKLRGKYNPTTKKRKYPNLQQALFDGISVKACTGCIRTAHKAPKAKK